MFSSSIRRGLQFSILLRHTVFVLLLLTFASVIYGLYKVIFSREYLGLPGPFEEQTAKNFGIAAFGGALGITFIIFLRELLASRAERAKEKSLEEKQLDLFNLVGRDNELAVTKLQLELEKIRMKDKALPDETKSELDYLISRCIELRKQHAPAEMILDIIKDGYSLLADVTKLR